MYIGLIIVSADIRHRETAMPYPPKNFEEVKVKGWKSGYLSVESVLRHLQRKASGVRGPQLLERRGFESESRLLRA